MPGRRGVERGVLSASLFHSGMYKRSYIVTLEKDL